MKNMELYSPACPDAYAKALVLAGPLRGLLDDKGSYLTERLLGMQLEVFKEWREVAREDRPDFECDFYEWMLREVDSAFVVKPGQLVKWDQGYGVVLARPTRFVVWVNHWHVVSESRVQEAWPQPIKEVEVKTPDGKVHVVDVLSSGAVGPADIPPEIFALACGRAKDCPMMKGE